MIVWLDQKIFGNGWGMKSPYWDDTYYWLSGEIYTFSFGFGAQLTNFQWTHPRADERRVLAGLEFKPFSSSRRWGRVRVSWALTKTGESVDEQSAAIAELTKRLREGWRP